jgi:predicted nucleic acid-binding protein
LIDIDNEIINQTIVLRKSKKIDLPDTIIAANALIYDLVLISRNTSDFKNIVVFKLVDPFKIQN